MFPNIKSLTINNYVFSDEDLDNINKNNIINYSYYKCDFTRTTTYDIINNVKALLFEKCKFNEYGFLNNEFKNLKILYIISPSDEEQIDISQMNCISKLEELHLEKCNVKNIKSISKFTSLEYLNILDTQVSKDDLLELANCPNLKEVCVSEKYVDNDIINILKEKNIQVKFNQYDLLLESEEK